MISKQQTLSLPAAIFVNINIMLGTGTFINTVLLAQHAGALGSFLYLVAGVLILPLILCIAQLTSLHKEGSFYNFGAAISPYWGFLNAWTYFVAKLASATLSIHVFVMFLEHIFPSLPLPAFVLDIAIISIFVLLNTLNTKTGSRIQYGFVVMKIMPLLFAIIAGLFCTKIINIGAPHFIWGGLRVALPLVFFCCLGFEATCSLSRLIENPQRNAPRAIVISFATVIILSFLYQFAFYGSLGTTLAAQKSYVGAFPLLVKLAVPQLLSILNPLFSIAIATSALGGAYGILYSNIWNLHTLAEKNQVFFSNKLTQLNGYQIPVWCVVTEGIICITYLLLTQGAQIPLQYTATLGCIMAYSISTISYFMATRSLLGIAGIATCTLLLGFCLSGFMSTSLAPLFLFGTILACGSGMFMMRSIES